MMRACFKLTIFALATILISPLLAGVWLESACSKTEKFFQGASQLLSLAPFQVGTFLRAAFYTHACTNVDREITIGFLTLLSHSDTEIGKHVYIGAQSNIGSCILGRDCLLGSGVHILSGKRQHDFSDPDTPIRVQGGVFEKIQIGENCWIGNNATVMASIGAQSIVAAGAVVVDDVPPRKIVGGNPARVLRSRWDLYRNGRQCGGYEGVVAPRPSPSKIEEWCVTQAHVSPGLVTFNINQEGISPIRCSRCPEMNIWCLLVQTVAQVVADGPLYLIRADNLNWRPETGLVCLEN